MAFEPRPLTGIAFKNKFKKSANQPDWRGTIYDKDGEEFQIAFWEKQGQKGVFMGIQLSAPYKKDGEAEKPARSDSKSPQQAQEDETDDLPF